MLLRSRFLSFQSSSGLVEAIVPEIGSTFLETLVLTTQSISFFSASKHKGLELLLIVRCAVHMAVVRQLSAVDDLYRSAEHCMSTECPAVFRNTAFFKEAVALE